MWVEALIGRMLPRTVSPLRVITVHPSVSMEGQ